MQLIYFEENYQNLHLSRVGGGWDWVLVTISNLNRTHFRSHPHCDNSNVWICLRMTSDQITSGHVRDNFCCHEVNIMASF